METGETNVPGWVAESIQDFEQCLDGSLDNKPYLESRKYMRFIGALYDIEERIDSLSDDQKESVTSEIVQKGIKYLKENDYSGEDYHFYAGNIATYLNNIRHTFKDRESFANNVCENLANLLGETNTPLAANMLLDCTKIVNDRWELYRSLYD